LTQKKTETYAPALIAGVAEDYYFLSPGFDNQNHQMMARIKISPSMFTSIIINFLLIDPF
jgi:acetoin utilization deacetylase AcuC-like enzyme